MDLDLEPGWEKKALIILGVIVVIIIAYAFNPFNHPAVVTDNNTTTDNSPAPVAPPAPTVAPNTTSNFTTNITNTSANFKLSADQAKKIVTDANSGFTAGQPTQANIMINNVTTAVWIVPLMSGNTVTKNIYVDASTGIIVGTEEVRN